MKDAAAVGSFEQIVLSSPLYVVVSALLAMLLMICLIRPQTFPFLRDKRSGFPSLGRQGQYAALLITTWGFITLIISAEMSEWYAGLYMLAWAGAQFGSVWLKLKGSALNPPQEVRERE